MEQVTVSRSHLLKVIERNREKHVKHYQRALVVFRSRLIATLKKALARARSGARVRLPIHLPSPVSYAREYDVVIGMLRMSTDKSVEITPSQYRQFVRDEWDWKHDFVANTMRYASAKAR